MNEATEQGKRAKYRRVADNIYQRVSARTGRTTYLVRFIEGHDAAGKRIQRYATARRLEDAKRKLRELQDSVSKGTYVKPSPKTLREWGEQWLDSLPVGNAADQITQRTLEGYRYLLRTHVFPKPIGAMQLQAIKPTDVKAWRAQLRESGRVAVRKDEKAPAGLSPTTVLHAYRALYTCLQDAVEDQLLRANPAALGRRRKRERVAMGGGALQIKALSPQESVTLLSAARAADPVMFTIIALGLAIGARRGELLGLRWSDIDFEKKTLHIARSVGVTRAHGVTITRPKTKKSDRVIGIRSETVLLLRAHRAEQMQTALKLGVKLPDDALVFPCLMPRKRGAQPSKRVLTENADFSQPWHPNAITKGFNRLAARCGLRGRRVHDLRHTHATQLIEAGVPIPAVADRLGHSSPVTTMTVYAHVLRTMESKAADAADEILRAALHGAAA